jgi:hypothetical protein
MEILAYAIWGALGGCVLVALLLFIYARVRSNNQDVVEAPSTDNENAPLELDIGRWEQMITWFGLHKCPVPDSDEKKMAWAQEHLGLEPEWLAGEDVSMYPFLSFNNAVEEGVDYIASLKDNGADPVLYVVKPRDVLLAEEIMDACAVLCFAATPSLPGCSIRRYYPVNVYWEWGYPPERVQCAQIIYTAIRAGLEIKGMEAVPEEVYALVEGKKIPEPLLHDHPPTWDPRSVAKAGEDLAGVKKGMLPAQELIENISARGWDRRENGRA